MFEDKTLVCKECGKEFVFTAGEQEFYAERGFQNAPQRCKACRDARKNATRGPREYYTATCAACGGSLACWLRLMLFLPTIVPLLVWVRIFFAQTRLWRPFALSMAVSLAGTGTGVI